MHLFPFENRFFSWNSTTISPSLLMFLILPLEAAPHLAASVQSESFFDLLLNDKRLLREAFDCRFQKWNLLEFSPSLGSTEYLPRLLPRSLLQREYFLSSWKYLSPQWVLRVQLLLDFSLRGCRGGGGGCCGKFLAGSGGFSTSSDGRSGTGLSSSYTAS